jgi:hypothetical protein
MAAVEHPFGLTLGAPGDAPRQLEVLRATLRALEEISRPGGIIHLQFKWNSRDKLNLHPPKLPPIVRYLRRHPWDFPKFLHRTPPKVPE